MRVREVRRRVATAMPAPAATRAVTPAANGRASPPAVPSRRRTVTPCALDMRSPSFVGSGPDQGSGQRETAGTVAGKEWSKKNTGLTGYLSHISST